MTPTPTRLPPTPARPPRVPPKHHPESGTIHVMSTDEFLRWDEIAPGLFRMVPAPSPYEIGR